MTTPSVQHAHTDLYFSSFESGKQIEGKKVLDIGCGDGHASNQFLTKGAVLVHALDPSTESATDDAGRPVTLDERARFFRNWHEVFANTPRGGYDIIWHHHVIEHVEDCFGFLREINDILADDGWMWMACPNMAQHSVFSPGHIHNFQAAQLIEVLRRTGFAVREARVWVQFGQLRCRVPKSGSAEYPEPMLKSLLETKRCPSDVLNDWRWKD